MQAKRGVSKGGLFQMNHSLGQNLLKSKVVVQEIVKAGETKPGDTILEIGPGNGNMTQEMLEKGCNVIAVEKDPRMVLELQKRFQGEQIQSGKLRIVNADILTIDISQLNIDLVISNIPYNISSAIIFKLLENPTFRRCVLLVQKEFADRIVARPGSEGWGRLAINAQLFATVKMIMKVSRKNFVPQPKVDSAVISIDPRRELPNIDFAEWDGLIKLCFSRPNRTIQATFRKKKVVALLDSNRQAFIAAHGMGIVNADMTTPEFIDSVINDPELILGASRPSSLDIEDFMNLLQRFNSGGLHFK